MYSEWYNTHVFVLSRLKNNSALCTIEMCFITTKNARNVNIAAFFLGPRRLPLLFVWHAKTLAEHDIKSLLYDPRSFWMCSYSLLQHWWAVLISPGFLSLFVKCFVMSTIGPTRTAGSSLSFSGQGYCSQRNIGHHFTQLQLLMEIKCDITSSTKCRQLLSIEPCHNPSLLLETWKPRFHSIAV